MHVDQAGKNRLLPEVDERDVLWRRRTHLVERADLANPAALDPDRLVGAVRAGAHVEYSAGFDEHRVGDRWLRASRRRADQRQQDERAHGG